MVQEEICRHEGCHSTLAYLWGQVTPRSGLSHASWDAVNNFWCDTVVFGISARFLVRLISWCQLLGAG
jgi:hypothetical protein